MQICILGGGLTGLSAAYMLSKNHGVHLIEREPDLGGCLASYDFSSYTIEKFYHHCFSSDTTLFQLLADLHISDRLEWRTGTTGYYVDGIIYPLSSPSDIIRYPYLSTIDKARLAWLTLRARKMDVSKLDSVTAKRFITEHLGNRIYESFFEPLLGSKFGERKEDVSAAWLISRIAIRSHRGAAGERLGYLRGGFQTLINSLESELNRSESCVIERGTAAQNMSKKNGQWYVNGRPYDAVISTIPPQQLHLIGGPDIVAPAYQGAACMTLGLDHDVAQGIYWLNLKDPAPYGAVVSHTNFVPRERYRENIVYLASYFTGTPPENLETRMLSDFCRRFKVDINSIHWHRLAVDPWAGPIYSTGYKSTIPQYKQNDLYVAGMFSEPNYPERSIEGSIRAGFEVASQITERTG